MKKRLWWLAVSAALLIGTGTVWAQNVQKYSETGMSAESPISGYVGVAIGWDRISLKGLKEYPFNGINTGIGVAIHCALDDMLKIGLGLSLGHVSVSGDIPLFVSDNYGYIYELDAKYTMTMTAVSLSPGFMYGTKTRYVGADLDMTLPSSGEASLKVSGYPAEREDIETEASFWIDIFGRYDYFGASLSLPLDADDSFGIGVRLYIPIPNLTIEVEVTPQFSYFWGDMGNEVVLGIGLRYVF